MWLTDVLKKVQTLKYLSISRNKEQKIIEWSKLTENNDNTVENVKSQWNLQQNGLNQLLEITEKPVVKTSMIFEDVDSHDDSCPEYGRELRIKRRPGIFLHLGGN